MDSGAKPFLIEEWSTDKYEVNQIPVHYIFVGVSHRHALLQGVRSALFARIVNDIRRASSVNTPDEITRHIMGQ